MAKLIYLTQNKTLGELSLVLSGGNYVGTLKEPAFCLYVSNDNGTIVTDIKGFTEKEQACFKTPQLLQVAPPSDSDFRKTNSDVSFFFSVLTSKYLPLYNDFVVSPTLVGTLAWSIIKTYEIPANTFNSGMVRCAMGFDFGGAGGNRTVGVYITNATGLSGAPFIFQTITSSVAYQRLECEIQVKGNLLYSSASGTIGGATPPNSLTAGFMTTALSTSQPIYIHVIGQLTNTGSAIWLKWFTSGIFKQN